MTAMIASLIGAQVEGAYAQEALQGPPEPARIGPLEVPALTPAAPDVPPLNVIATPAADAQATLPDAGGPNVTAPPASLEELVRTISGTGDLSRELHCLASAIYFEARGEPLIGQLAVGHVVVNRAGSGRFPASYCGVVFQKAQFSFVRAGRMPAINRTSQAWKRAAALATIADAGLWASPAPDALFFHASYVKPRWKLQRVGQISTHVFYR